MEPVSYTHLDVYKRQKLYAAVLAGCAVGGRAGDGLQLLTLAPLVALDIDDDRVAIPYRADRDGGYQELQSIERLAMAADEHRKICLLYTSRCV